MSATVSLTLDQLANILGKPDQALLDLLAPPENNAQYVAAGGRIKSSRIITDATRIYGLAYAVWSKATPFQTEALIGFSLDQLSVAVDRAIALRDLTSDLDDAIHADAASLDEHEGCAAAARMKGLARRDHAANVLRRIAARDEALCTRLDREVGTAASADGLAKGMERLAKVGEEWLALNNGPVAARIKLARLDQAYLDKLKNTAGEVRTSARAASARATSPKASQGDIDLLDGINLQLLGDIMHAFDLAHDIDPTIPRLVPIATRHVLGKRSHGAEPLDESAPEAPAVPKAAAAVPVPAAAGPKTT